MSSWSNPTAPYLQRQRRAHLLRVLPEQHVLLVQLGSHTRIAQGRFEAAILEHGVLEVLPLRGAPPYLRQGRGGGSVCFALFRQGRCGGLYVMGRPGRGEGKREMELVLPESGKYSLVRTTTRYGTDRNLFVTC